MKARNSRLRRLYRRRHARGMTLIEIMVVLVILGMIAGAIGYNVIGQLREANIREAKTDVRHLSDMVDAYQMEKGKLPDTLQDLVTAGVLKDLHGDPWGQAYVYVKNGADKCEIVSYGPDKAQGGGDDISSVASANANGSNGNSNGPH